MTWWPKLPPLHPFTLLLWCHTHNGTVVTLALHLHSVFLARVSVYEPNTVVRGAEDSQMTFSVSVLSAPLLQQQCPNHKAAIPKPWISKSHHTSVNKISLQGRNSPSAMKSLQPTILLCSTTHRGSIVSAWAPLSAPPSDLSLAQILITTAFRQFSLIIS